MTDRTLKAKLEKLAALKKQINDLEKIKNDLSETVIEEFKTKNIDNLNGYKLVTFQKEYISKKNIPAKIWDRYKTITAVEYIR